LGFPGGDWGVNAALYFGAHIVPAGARGGDHFVIRVKDESTGGAFEIERRPFRAAPAVIGDDGIRILLPLPERLQLGERAFEQLQIAR
jgi:hypothetical protein